MDPDRLSRASRLEEIRECFLQLARLEAYPASRVEELHVVSDRQVVEGDSGEERRGIVGLATVEEHVGEEAGAVRGCGRKLPQRR